MKNLNELKQAIRNNEVLFFMDDNEKNLINYVQEITNELDEISPILVTYDNENSEAEIFLHEIKSNSQIENFFKAIEIDNLNILDYIEIDEIDHNHAFESVFEMIHENGGFDIEIIYYSNAIEYLKRHDNCLTESIELAIEYGYTIENLNSEVLASLLASKNCINDFVDYRDEINEFFYNLN